VILLATVSVVFQGLITFCIIIYLYTQNTDCCANCIMGLTRNKLNVMVSMVAILQQ